MPSSASLGAASVVVWVETADLEAPGRSSQVVAT
jgi:hypothetical protein